MGTWLSQRLAERLGVWAGGRFPFPRRFVDEILRATLGDAAPLSGFSADHLLWPVMAELPEHLEHGAFTEVARFIDHDAGSGGRGQFQLARRIATAFEQYVVFRPQMVLQWEAGREDHWQARLWRSVSKRLGGRHPAALARDLFAALKARRPAGLPHRVSVFGTSTLPPFYLEVFEALDRYVPVHLFIVSPSNAYWAEVRSDRELLRRGELPDDDDDAAPPLLASLGGVGRDFQRVLESTADYVEPLGDLYVDPGRDTLLHALQSDLLQFQRSEDTPADPSIAVHACHSPMREVEVLHDQVLDLLARDPSLQPHEIAVLCSDVETYAPLVEAVFERDSSDPTYVPYCLADRTLRADSPIVETFHRLLDLVGGRVTSSEVLDLLTLAPIQQRFHISADDVDTIGTWIAEAGVRWGIDETHRRHHKQPGLRENTWRFGLDRLFLGYALPGQGETFGGVKPYDELEGQQTLLLGRFAELCEHVFAFVQRLEEPRSPRNWQQALTELVDALLDGPVESARELLQLRTALDAIATDADEAGFSGAVPLSRDAASSWTSTSPSRARRGGSSPGASPSARCCRCGASRSAWCACSGWATPTSPARPPPSGST